MYSPLEMMIQFAILIGGVHLLWVGMIPLAIGTYKQLTGR